MRKYTISDTNLHIENSYQVKKFTEMHSILLTYRHRSPQSQVWTRTIKSLIREWRGHNCLYELGLFRSHTKDVDLDVPEKWYTQICYYILSAIYDPVLKVKEWLGLSEE